jgi:hypothetical protein
LTWIREYYQSSDIRLESFEVIPDRGDGVKWYYQKIEQGELQGEKEEFNTFDNIRLEAYW